MGSNLEITKEIENYINNHSLELNPTQKEIIITNGFIIISANKKYYIFNQIYLIIMST